MKNEKNISYDAVIVGAGPAGAAAARKLSLAGWRVAVIEKETLGRDRVCGGFLGPEAQQLFDSLELPDALEESHAVAVDDLLLSDPFHKTLAAPVHADGAPEAWGVNREVFDLYLMQKAIAAGAECFERFEIKTVRESDGVISAEVVSEGIVQTLTCGILIHAAGRRRPQVITGKTFFALKTTYQGLSGMYRRVALHFVKEGHVGFNQLGGGRFNMCLYIRKRRMEEASGDMDRFMEILAEENPAIRAHLDGALRIGKWHGCPAEPDYKRLFFDGSSFYIGDAVTMANPIIGGGLGIAIGSACLLAEALIDAEKSGKTKLEAAAVYKRAWEKSYGKKIDLSQLLGLCERSRLITRGIFHFLSSYPALVDRMIRLTRPHYAPKQTVSAASAIR